MIWQRRRCMRRVARDGDGVVTCGTRVNAGWVRGSAAGGKSAGAWTLHLCCCTFAAAPLLLHLRCCTFAAFSSSDPPSPGLAAAPSRRGLNYDDMAAKEVHAKVLRDGDGVVTCGTRVNAGWVRGPAAGGKSTGAWTWCILSSEGLLEAVWVARRLRIFSGG
eukprot:CAMPEP_0174912338 /NCGR_PEP_ID=MMETSP0167-20121228/79734_1 /TAXON_ID=38298 /ORGANISM="Rhodella maculata, Strain CCMP736" /LENGTH=161 /DNA_ID=CAMNT_0016156983 /DNA_START=343 /DNA_END=829 /DNA_ORIENTATION=+